MKKTVAVMLDLDTDSAWVSDLTMVCKKDAGFEFVDAMRERISIDNAAEFVRNWLGDMLEVQEW